MPGPSSTTQNNNQQITGPPVNTSSVPNIINPLYTTQQATLPRMTQQSTDSYNSRTEPAETATYMNSQKSSQLQSISANSAITRAAELANAITKSTSGTASSPASSSGTSFSTNEIFGSIFQKSNIVFLFWVLAIYILVTFAMYIFKSPDPNVPTEITMTRTFDFICICILTAVVVMWYFHRSEAERETEINDGFHAITSYADNATSLFSTGLFIFVFYFSVYIVGIPMEYASKPTTVSIIESVAWITFTFSLMCLFFHMVMHISLKNLFDTLWDEFWNGKDVADILPEIRDGATTAPGQTKSGATEPGSTTASGPGTSTAPGTSSPGPGTSTTSYGLAPGTSSPGPGTSTTSYGLSPGTTSPGPGTSTTSYGLAPGTSPGTESSLSPGPSSSLSPGTEPNLTFGMDSSLSPGIASRLSPGPAPEEMPKEEVFNIANNMYTYEDAQTICSAFDSRLATYDEIEQAYNDGGEWCNYGWSADQMIFFPTQKSTWDALQETKNKNSCGRPGVNGGYIDNPYARFGVNCFGVKPGPKDTDIDRLNELGAHPGANIPLSEEDQILEMKVQYWKEHADELLQINSFNSNKWSEF